MNRMAMDIGKKGFREIKTIRACIKNQYKSDGLKGLYQGFTFSLVGVFIYRFDYWSISHFQLGTVRYFFIFHRALYFGLYDTFSDRFHNAVELSFWFKFFLAEVSASTAGIISYPLDTVRRSMMLQSGFVKKKYVVSWHFQFNN